MIYKNETYQKERALYGLKKDEVTNCRFEGKEDGESPLKECEDISVSKCHFALRYPMWHDVNLKINKSTLTESCRAPLWYCNNVMINFTNCNGVKAIRECNGVKIDNSTFVSDEFGWRCKNVTLTNSRFEGPYFLFESKNVKVNNCKLKGKYSFQYIKNLEVDNCEFDTKDAFWHVDNAVVTNSYLKGEYIGWYSKNLVLINCTIEGTQPFCYCKNLKLINCKMVNTDFSFENSSVNATIIGKVMSIKNPLRGKIVVDEVDDVILQDYKNKPKAKIIVKNK